MTLVAGIALVVLVVHVQDSTAIFWGNSKVDCAVSVWSEWRPSGGGHSRTRTIARNARNGGKACSSLKETMSSIPKDDPWNKGQVSARVQNNFLTGDRHYLKFILNGLGASINVMKIAVKIDIPSDPSYTSRKTTVTLLPRDLLFIVDMSGSISSSDWSITKQNLADLIGRLCGSIGPERQHNRIAIITFASRVVLNFDFKAHWTLNSVRKAILGMKQSRGATCTGDAFVYAQQYMFDPEKGIRSATESVKEVLVLTDGHSNCGADLSREVQRLKVKAFVYALAIGNYGARGRAEIESMVSRPLIDHVFSVANFFEFSKMVEFLLTLTEPCIPFELS